MIEYRFFDSNDDEIRLNYPINKVVE